MYTLDADLVVAASNLGALSDHLRERFTSELRIQFATDERCQSFLSRSVEAEVLGVRTRIACLDDVVQGKLWAYLDPARRLSKRKKDELDLIRLAEKYPALKARYPSDIQRQIDRG